MKPHDEVHNLGKTRLLTKINLRMIKYKLFAIFLSGKDPFIPSEAAVHKYLLFSVEMQAVTQQKT